MIRCLHPSLPAPQGKTLMVLNVGPEESNSHETLCSLRFASHVGQCDVGGSAKRTATKTGGAGKAAAPAKAAPGGAGSSKAPPPRPAGGRPQTAPPQKRAR